MKVRSFSHVGITVKDFGKAVQWYDEVLGLTLISELELSAEKIQELQKLYNLPAGTKVKLGFLRTPKGGVVEIFEFSKTLPFQHSWNRPGATHFALDVKNIKKWHSRLQKRDDIDLLCPPQNTDGNEWMFFRDPDGNLIELIDLKLNYFAIRYLGPIVNFVMRNFVFSKYYK